jgi:hypothetical protein
MNLKMMYWALTETINVPSSMCVMYICCKQHTPHDALVGGRAENTLFLLTQPLAVLHVLLQSFRKWMRIHPTLIMFNHLMLLLKVPEFDLFLALLIVREAERLVQIPSHLTATEAELLAQCHSLLTAGGRNTGLVSFPALRHQRRTTGPFSFPPDSNGGRITGRVSFPPDGNGGRTTGPDSFPPDGNSSWTIGPIHSRRVVAALELLHRFCTDFVSVCS